MVALEPGSIVAVRFPFSDLTGSKVRPAVVLAHVGRGDYLLCQVTSKPYGDEESILLEDGDFSVGSLRVRSHARAGKIFTANILIVVKPICKLKPDRFRSIVETIIRILRRQIL